MFRTIRRKVFRLALVSGAGAAATYFFDKDHGQERREQAKTKADTLLKRSTPASTAWQPERATNIFDTTVTTPVTTPVVAPAPVVEPALTDVIATPDREIDPLATRP